MDSSLLCSICLQSLEDVSTVIVQEKGLQILIAKSKQKNDDKWKLWVSQKQYIFHEKCRKRYAVSSSKPKATPEPNTQQSSLLSDVPSTSTRSIAQPTEISTTFSGLASNFEFDKACFICGKPWDRAHKHGSMVQENRLKDRVIAIATERDDDLGQSIILRLERTGPLVDLKARYHTACYKNLMAPFYSSAKRAKIDEINPSFEKICDYIESSGQFKFQLSSLKAMVGEDEQNQIETRTLLRHLRKTYRDDIFIFKKQGKESIIYYKYHEFAKICSDWYGDREGLTEMAKKSLISVCAEILQDEIKKSHYDTKTYPQPNKFLDNIVSDIPPLLTTFLQKLLINDENKMSDDCPIIRKIDNIAHSIISVIRPKSFISSLQLAVATYIYRKTGSKLVINLLNKLGICSSYHKVQLHEASSIINPQTIIVDNAFVQYVFDNTDHNVSTLDGHETFHCLGGIAVYTPESSVSYHGTITRCTKMPSAATLASQSVITDVVYDDRWPSGLKNIIYENTNALLLGMSPLISQSYMTFLSSKCFKINKMPMWRGFMEKISEDVEFVVSHIKCLPFINRPPSQFSTLNTALHHAAEGSRPLGQKTTFVTYDQPLYLKARNIVAQLEDGEAKYEKLKHVVVRLGGFHLLMSYLGAIGSIMAESGLEELWSVPYAPESVKKMLTGHAFSRAIRAHILTFTALGVIIHKSIDGYEQFEEIIKEFLAGWPERSPSMNDCESNEKIHELTQLFTERVSCLERNGATAKLWTQYFKSVLFALQFIEAERLGNWKLHLQSIKNMLPIFHAAGHYPYAKCAHLYLQDMSKLEMVMDDAEYENFTKNGFFTIRRSQKAWAGVWSDMTIEQTLNRYFGTDLKHGRGVTPSVVARYLSSMPSAFSIMENLEQYCGITTLTSEQHVESTSSRISRDEADMAKMIYWLDQRDPFIPRDHLISLSTGVIGGPNIDCFNAFEKGEKGIESMIGKTVDEATLSKGCKVQTLADAKKGMISNQSNFTTINPSLLFQRISTILKDNHETLRSALEYELSPFPMSLFDEKGYMRKTTKADVYKIFTPFIQSTVFLTNSHFVVDGGWLLHQVSWPHGKTFKTICEGYMKFIKRHFPTSTIVFDGYSNEIVVVKTYERFRRQEKNFAPDLNIEMEMTVSLTREKFLSNVLNKQKLINLLSEFLRQAGINVEEAEGDADTLIVRTAIRLDNELNQSIVVAGNDVDLLILLIDQTPENRTLYFYKMGSNHKENTLFSTLNNRKFKPYILFAHAFVGCDTTSALFKKGKRKIISLLEKDENLAKTIRTFYEPEQNIETLCNIAEKIIFHLYLPENHRKRPTTIPELRYKLFNSAVYQYNRELSLAVLPPTVPALKEHTKRVYYQVQEWLGNQLNPENWGWKFFLPAVMFPVMTTAPPAPDELIRSIHCNCQKCDSNRCTCRKSGIRCSEFCKNCEGITCQNHSLQNLHHLTTEDDGEEGENEIEDDNSGTDEPQLQEEIIETEVENLPNQDESMEIDFENYYTYIQVNYRNKHNK